MYNLGIGHFKERIEYSIRALSKIPENDQEGLKSLLDRNNSTKIELIGTWLNISGPIHLLYLVMENNQHSWFDFPNLSELTGTMFVGNDVATKKYKELASSKNIKLNIIYPEDNNKSINTPNIIVDEKFSENVLTDRYLFPDPNFKGTEIDLGLYKYIRKSGEIKQYRHAVIEVIQSKETPHTVDLYIKEKGTNIRDVEKVQLEAKECSLYSHPLVPVRKTPKEITFLGTFSLSVDDPASFAYLTKDYLEFRLKKFHLPEKVFEEIYKYMESLDHYCNIWREYIKLLANDGFIISNSPKSKRLTKLGLSEIEIPEEIQKLFSLDKNFVDKLAIDEGLDNPEYITYLFIYKNSYPLDYHNFS